MQISHLRKESFIFYEIIKKGGRNFFCDGIGMDKDKYLTVGEAAKELGINKNTLLYYDREGVIISLRDENNYRYYHINQIKNIRAILNFRKLGFSLEEIRKIKENIMGNRYEFILEKISEQMEISKKEIYKLEARIKLLENHKRYIEVLDEITQADREFIFIDKQNYCFSKKENYFFHINQIKNEEQAVLYTTREIDDLNAVQMLFQKIEERGYITDGDMSVEVVTPFGENPKNKNRIKIYKIHVKSLTSEQLTGLE